MSPSGALPLRAQVLAALFAERRQAKVRLQEALAAGSVRAFECNLCSGPKVTTVRTRRIQRFGVRAWRDGQRLNPFHRAVDARPAYAKRLAISVAPRP